MNSYTLKYLSSTSPRYIYVGGAENCTPSNFGILYKQDSKRRYSCTFSGGKMHGIGHIKYPHGREFLGNIQYGVKHGVGWILYPGKVYLGEFANGNKVGVGELAHYSSQLQIFKGTFKEGKLEGFGIHETEDSKFYGNFTKGIADGLGILQIKKTGYSSQGIFKSGELQGIGKISSGSSESFFGQFEKGKKNGIGILLTKLGYYQGHFKNDIQEGNGIIINKDGSFYYGVWSEGVNIFGAAFQDDHPIGYYRHGNITNDLKPWEIEYVSIQKAKGFKKSILKDLDHLKTQYTLINEERSLDTFKDEEIKLEERLFEIRKEYENIKSAFLEHFNHFQKLLYREIELNTKDSKKISQIFQTFGMEGEYSNTLAKSDIHESISTNFRNNTKVLTPLNLDSRQSQIESVSYVLSSTLRHKELNFESLAVEDVGADAYPGKLIMGDISTHNIPQSGYKSICNLKDTLILAGQKGTLTFGLDNTNCTQKQRLDTINIVAVAADYRNNQFLILKKNPKTLSICNNALELLEEINLSYILKEEDLEYSGYTKLTVNQNIAAWNLSMNIILFDLENKSVKVVRKFFMIESSISESICFDIEIKERIIAGFSKSRKSGDIYFHYSSEMTKIWNVNKIIDISSKFKVCNVIKTISLLKHKRLVIGGESQSKEGNKPFLLISDLEPSFKAPNCFLLKEEKAQCISAMKVIYLSDYTGRIICGTKLWLYLFNFDNLELSLCQKLKIANLASPITSIEIIHNRIFMISENERLLRAAEYNDTEQTEMKSDIDQAGEESLMGNLDNFKNTFEHFNNLSEQQKFHKRILSISTAEFSEFSTSKENYIPIHSHLRGDVSPSLILELARLNTISSISPGLLFKRGGELRISKFDNSLKILLHQKNILSFEYPSRYLHFDNDRAHLIFDDCKKGITLLYLTTLRTKSFENVLKGTSHIDLVKAATSPNAEILLLCFNSKKLGACLRLKIENSQSKTVRVEHLFDEIVDAEFGFNNQHFFVAGVIGEFAALSAFSIDSNLTFICDFLKRGEECLKLSRIKGSDALVLSTKKSILFINFAEKRFFVEKELDFVNVSNIISHVQEDLSTYVLLDKFKGFATIKPPQTEKYIKIREKQRSLEIGEEKNTLPNLIPLDEQGHKKIPEQLSEFDIIESQINLHTYFGELDYEIVSIEYAQRTNEIYLINDNYKLYSTCYDEEKLIAPQLLNGEGIYSIQILIKEYCAGFASNDNTVLLYKAKQLKKKIRSNIDPLESTILALTRHNNSLDNEIFWLHGNLGVKRLIISEVILNNEHNSPLIPIWDKISDFRQHIVIGLGSMQMLGISNNALVGLTLHKITRNFYLSIFTTDSTSINISESFEFKDKVILSLLIINDSRLLLSGYKRENKSSENIGFISLISISARGNTPELFMLDNLFLNREDNKITILKKVGEASSTEPTFAACANRDIHILTVHKDRIVLLKSLLEVNRGLVYDTCCYSANRILFVGEGMGKVCKRVDLFETNDN